MFKVGDKVRFLGSAENDDLGINDIVPIGTEGRITQLFEFNEDFPLTVEFDNGVDTPVEQSEVELVEPAPSSDSDAHA